MKHTLELTRAELEVIQDALYDRRECLRWLEPRHPEARREDELEATTALLERVLLMLKEKE